VPEARIAIPWRVLPDGPDYLLQCLTNTPDFHRLLAWQFNTPGIPAFPADYRRLQLEKWVWDHRADLAGTVMDVGVEFPRRWVGDGYFTFGVRGCDAAGDVQALPYPDGHLDAALCTEVLEHVENPFEAVGELHRCLKPGGVLLASGPFLCPDHHCDGYPDYWRFTVQGWARLLSAFAEVSIEACEYTDEGGQAAELMRRFEGMQWRDPTRWTTAYLVRAVK
jgi:SAM-dependent methyltransferase